MCVCVRVGVWFLLCSSAPRRTWELTGRVDESWWDEEWWEASRLDLYLWGQALCFSTIWAWHAPMHPQLGFSLLWCAVCVQGASCLTWVRTKFGRNAYLQERHSVMKGNSRLALLTSIPKVQKIQDVGDPGGSWHGKRALCQKPPSHCAGHSWESTTWLWRIALVLRQERELTTLVWLVGKWSTTVVPVLKWNPPALGKVATRMSSGLAWKFCTLSQLSVKYLVMETPWKSNSVGRGSFSIYERAIIEKFIQGQFIYIFNPRWCFNSKHHTGKPLPFDSFTIELAVLHSTLLFLWYMTSNDLNELTAQNFSNLNDHIKLSSSHLAISYWKFTRINVRSARDISAN